MFLAIALLLIAAQAHSQNVTELWTRGYSVVPAPRTVRLTDGDVVFDARWTLDDTKPGANHIAVRSLVRDMAEFHSLSLRRGASGTSVRLAVSAGAVATKSEPEVDAQAYRLVIGDQGIEITGNADAGLFYGVQTLVQLFKRDSAGRLLLPKATIEDWPKLQLRFLHWDTKHHQDRMETLKRYLDWSARIKANMIGFELEDKFEYPSHPEIGAPGAFTTAQLQEIVNYGLERFIQVVPVVQSPAHFAYVLKHAQFAALRADGNNYQSKLCDPRTYDLIFSMYDDVVKATQGVKYFFVSTDEVYYAGIEGTCRPYTPENRSLTWAEFVKGAREHLAKQGRRILVWAEYPLLPQHMSMIPPDVIDGVIGNQGYIPIENKLGMRQLAYVSTQGSEYLFPDHLAVETERGMTRSKVASVMESIATGKHWSANPIGTFGAAWGDMGLHNETFWLGWSAVAQAGWNPGGVSAEQHVAEFMKLYYGANAAGMTDIYRSMQRQARSWANTWDRVTSRVRAAGYGNSYGPGRGTERRDMTLSPPALPAMPELARESFVTEKYGKFIADARGRMPENEQLVEALMANLGRIDRNRYNLEVLLSLARFTGHHWHLLNAFDEVERMLDSARDAAQKKNAQQAVSSMVTAYNAMDRVRKDGEKMFADLTAVFEKSQFPKGRTVNGRNFMHVLDDTKDHWADRTPDLGYMMQPERGIGLDKWTKDLYTVIQAYAKEHNVQVRGFAEARLEQ